MTEKQLEDIIKNYHLGKLSQEQQMELAELLSDPQNYEIEQLINSEWRLILETNEDPDRDLTLVLEQIHKRIRRHRFSQQLYQKSLQTLQRAAAILILPLLFSFIAYYYFQNNKENQVPTPPVPYAEIQCPLGVRTKFQLPDGSTGYLNSGATLKFPVQFLYERKVELSGEAFFDIVHNENLPFNVATKNLDIKVLGTTFNVIANDDEQTEEIVLQTGKVDVSSKAGKPLAQMIPNEQLTLDINNQTFTKHEVEASQYTSWKEGKLAFRNENMQEVAKRLSRWYNINVEVGDKQLEEYTFHATFIDEPLSEVLKLIALTTPISYKEEKRLTDKDGVYQKRKILLRINQSKISQFR